MSDMPEREQIVWEDPDLHASLTRGLTGAEEGEAKPLPWVTEDADQDDDEDS